MSLLNFSEQKSWQTLSAVHKFSATCFSFPNGFAFWTDLRWLDPFCVGLSFYLYLNNVLCTLHFVQFSTCMEKQKGQFSAVIRDPIGLRKDRVTVLINRLVMARPYSMNGRGLLTH